MLFEISRPKEVLDNYPRYISTQLLKSQPWKMERKVGEKTVWYCEKPYKSRVFEEGFPK